MKKLAGGVRIAQAQYRELAAFAQFASDLDQATRKQLERGQRVTEVMKQKQYAPLSVAEMAVSLYAVDKGYLDAVPVNKVSSVELEVIAYCNTNHAELMAEINKTGQFNDDIAGKMAAAIDACMKTLTWE
jgi:F-type H+-transporting ATPase subunit alpha